MNADYTHQHWRDPRPTTPEALAFWKRGQADLDEAENHRRTNWTLFSNLVNRGVAMQCAAHAMDKALTMYPALPLPAVA